MELSSLLVQIICLNEIFKLNLDYLMIATIFSLFTAVLSYRQYTPKKLFYWQKAGFNSKVKNIITFLLLSTLGLII